MKGQRRSDDHSQPRRRARGVFTLAALLALFLQVFVVQTHVHALPLASTSIEQSADAADHSVHVTAVDHQAQCVICQALTTAGSTTLTAASAVIDAQYAANEVTAVAIRAAPRILALPWQSRAPPIVL